MKYFTAIYTMPVEGLEEWLKIPEEQRKSEEEAMKKEWDVWLEANKSSIKNTIGLGKTKRVSSDGIVDTKNSLMLSSYVEAESHEAAAEIFRNHPHLKIPGAAIDIMEANDLKGM